MRFSERAGFRPIKQLIQTDDIDTDLRNSLWNVFSERFHELELTGPMVDRSTWINLYYSIWRDFWKKAVDDIPPEIYRARQAIREWFFKAPWFEAYDFIEFLSNWTGSKAGGRQFENEVNAVLERELAGYRLVSRVITPITDENELEAIHTAIAENQSAGAKAVTEHLQTALSLLADRRSPDYRNSIKESISAVEALVRIFAADSKTELAKGLRVIADELRLHGALKNSILSLYGYTSDEGGVRHSLVDEPDVHFEDAKFMLVSCSALVHFLRMRRERLHPGAAAV